MSRLPGTPEPTNPQVVHVARECTLPSESTPKHTNLYGRSLRPAFRLQTVTYLLITHEASQPTTLTRAITSPAYPK